MELFVWGKSSGTLWNFIMGLMERNNYASSHAYSFFTAKLNWWMPSIQHTRASKTKLSYRSESEFSIRMLNNASKVSCKNYTNNKRSNVETFGWHNLTTLTFASLFMIQKSQLTENTMTTVLIRHTNYDTTLYNNNNTCLMAFAWDYLGEPVPER